MSFMLQQQRRMAQQKHTGEPVPEVPTAPVTAEVRGGSIGKQQIMELVSKALAEDLRALDALKNKEQRIALKADQLVPKYQPYVEKLKSHGTKHPLFTHMVLWLFDTGEISKAVALGLWAVKTQQPAPESFRRDVPTIVADCVHSWASAELDVARSPEPYLSTVISAMECGASPWVAPEQTWAKLYAAYGAALEQADQYEMAIDAYQVALHLGAKVKTVLGKLQKKVG